MSVQTSLWSVLPVCTVFSCSLYMNIAFRAFCTIMTISRHEEAPSRDYAILLFRMTSRVLYSAQYNRQHCTLQAFEQFEALYMHNHDDKYLSRPGLERGTPRLQDPVDTNEPWGPARQYLTRSKRDSGCVAVRTAINRITF